jgi:hypothetical protein
LAVAFRNLEQPEFVFIRLPETYTASPETRIALQSGDARHVLRGGFIEKNLFAARNTEFLFEKFALTAKFSDILLFDQNDGVNEYAFLDIVYFHNSFFIDFFEATQNPDIYLFQGTFPKAAPLGIVTCWDGTLAALRLWVSYYSRLVAPPHLYVLDTTGTLRADDLGARGVNVVGLPAPDNDVTQADMHRDAAQDVGAVNRFQRFLLSQYQWVMQTSCNEIMLHRDGIEAFITTLGTRASPMVIRPGRSYVLTSTQWPPGAGDAEQMERLSEDARPVLSSLPITWESDFATIREASLTVTEPHLWRVRLAQPAAPATPETARPETPHPETPHPETARTETARTETAQIDTVPPDTAHIDALVAGEV